jgi:hypothetical protein
MAFLILGARRWPRRSLAVSVHTSARMGTYIAICFDADIPASYALGHHVTWTTMKITAPLQILVHGRRVAQTIYIRMGMTRPRSSRTAGELQITRIQIRPFALARDMYVAHRCTPGSTVTSNHHAAHIAGCMHTRFALPLPACDRPRILSSLGGSAKSKQPPSARTCKACMYVLTNMLNIRIASLLDAAAQVCMYARMHPRYPGPPALNTSRMNAPAPFLQGTKSFISCASRTLAPLSAHCKAE